MRRGFRGYTDAPADIAAEMERSVPIADDFPSPEELRAVPGIRYTIADLIRRDGREPGGGLPRISGTPFPLPKAWNVGDWKVIARRYGLSPNVVRRYIRKLLLAKQK